jgi:hypothetical protein
MIFIHPPTLGDKTNGTVAQWLYAAQGLLVTFNLGFAGDVIGRPLMGGTCGQRRSEEANIAVHYYTCSSQRQTTHEYMHVGGST